MKIPAIFLLAVLTLFGATNNDFLQAAVPLPDESDHTHSLNGIWRFKLEQAPPPPRYLGPNGRPIPIILPATMEPFYRTDYQEEGAWTNIAVPSNWEIAGFSPATYHQPDNASAFYRLEFTVPPEWQGRLVKINFDGVQNGCEIWCNGRPVPVDEGSWGRTNYHESGWTAWQADLTQAIHFGQTNLLALRVTKNTKSVDCDTGDFFFLGGVYRPVTLFSVPGSHLGDITVQTKLLPNDQAAVVVLAQVNDATAGEKVTMQLEGQSPMEAEVDASGRVRLSQPVDHPHLWSAEFPHLYRLAVDLKDTTGNIAEHWSSSIGIREVSTRNGIFYVNNIPVKLAGICRHDVYPTLGAAVGPAVWRQDLALMKAANFNAIRTSHYPYGSGFYDLCDQMGFYVLDEEPFCWVDCTDTNLLPAFAQRSRETVRRDKNHPSVVIWGIGNENNGGPDSTLAAEITGEMDPTRPRVISCKRADEGGAHVEFDDRHYVTPQQIHEAEHDPRRAKWPMLYTENPNIWDVRNGPDYGSLILWEPVIVRTWNELWHDDHVAGTFLWEWQDRAVADQCPTKYYYFYPETGISLLKVKGLVDGFRNPRPEYYSVKMAQTPIAVGAEPEVAGDTVALMVTNRYSFTDLHVLRIHWALIAGGKTVDAGLTSGALAPRSQGKLALHFPADALAAADTLRLDFDHPDGWNVVTHQFFLKQPSHTPPAAQPVTGIQFPRFNLLTGKIVRDKKDWNRLDRSTGELVDLRVLRGDSPAVAMDGATLATLPFTSVRSLDAKVELQPGNHLVGRVHAAVTNGEMSWNFVWTANRSDVYELGWVFHAPAGIDHFSWDRQATWSFYPPDHIGRPAGTATPDSARAQLTKLDRLDAFDFNSTKFQCRWASLTDIAAHGICLVFPSTETEDVRGGVGADGACELIVDRCYSPPRDISSDIVPDLYTVLHKNEEIRAHFRIEGLAGDGQ